MKALIILLALFAVTFANDQDAHEDERGSCTKHNEGATDCSKLFHITSLTAPPPLHNPSSA
jgi:hypothetical protein